MKVKILLKQLECLREGGLPLPWSLDHTASNLCPLFTLANFLAAQTHRAPQRIGSFPQALFRPHPVICHTRMTVGHVLKAGFCLFDRHETASHFHCIFALA